MNIMGEILSRDVTLLTCRQKIIVKVNIMGKILSRDVTLLTCRQKIIVKVNLLEAVNLISLKEICLSSLDLVQPPTSLNYKYYYNRTTLSSQNML